jgi:hypothetical protein
MIAEFEDPIPKKKENPIKEDENSDGSKPFFAKKACLVVVNQAKQTDRQEGRRMTPPDPT